MTKSSPTALFFLLPDPGVTDIVMANPFRDVSKSVLALVIMTLPMVLLTHLMAALHNLIIINTVRPGSMLNTLLALDRRSASDKLVFCTGFNSDNRLMFTPFILTYPSSIMIVPETLYPTQVHGKMSSFSSSVPQHRSEKICESCNIQHQSEMTKLIISIYNKNLRKLKS